MDASEPENQTFAQVVALITARTHEFSNENIHIPGRVTLNVKYSGPGEFVGLVYGLKVFPNGLSEANKGYVCVTFDCLSGDLTYTGQCIISLIDASQDQKFSQTFIFADEKIRKQECIQYISREKLLSNPDEFLPNDVLTLLIDAYFIERAPPTLGRPDIDLNNLYRRTVGGSIEFYLDTPLGRCLAKESNFFREICMIEDGTSTMPIDEKEIKSFKHFGRIFREENVLDFESVKDIFDLYIVADKYDIPTVIELCTGFLKLCLLDHTVDKYLEVADEYENEYFKELIINLINVVRNTDFDEEMRSERGGVRLRQPIHNYLWFYKKRLWLRFETAERPTFIPQEDEIFDFYK